MRLRTAREKLPGYLATALVIVVTTLWTFWGMVEMYYEGWWGTWDVRLPYLVPAAACLTLSLVAITWARAGGWMLVGIGGIFTAWWWGMAIREGLFTPARLLSTFPVSGLVLFVGLLFLIEGRQRQWAEGRRRPEGWLQRYLPYILAVGIPGLVVLAVSIYWLPIVLTRLDDSYRGARLIEGNGVTLIWVPAGPGWGPGSDQEEDRATGTNPNLSWNDLALYGAPPVGFGPKAGNGDRQATMEDMSTTGLCLYLSGDGLTLREEPQGVWRMPTTNEIVRSLVRDGENAGCTWDGTSAGARCEVTPDKEMPLWVPSWSPIYYWSGDEYDQREAYYVSYHGGIVSHQDKSWGNPRHGYRCVREP